MLSPLNGEFKALFWAGGYLMIANIANIKGIGMDERYEFSWDAHKKSCPWNEATKCKAISARECCEQGCAPFFWLQKVIDHFSELFDGAKEQAEAESEAMKNIDRGKFTRFQ
jgi:hypothetical protein